MPPPPPSSNPPCLPVPPPIHSVPPAGLEVEKAQQQQKSRSSCNEGMRNGMDECLLVTVGTRSHSQILLLLAPERRYITPKPAKMSAHCENIQHRFELPVMISILGQFSPVREWNTNIYMHRWTSSLQLSDEFTIYSGIHTDWKSPKHSRGKLSHISLYNRLMCCTVLRRYCFCNTSTRQTGGIDITTAKFVTAVEVHFFCQHRDL